MSEYFLTFITQRNFEKNVEETLDTYRKSVKPIDLEKFNRNCVDPIKLLFDKCAYGVNFEKIISWELHRQRDKTTTNAIGYFHQNMFNYVKGCVVPDTGWDVIYRDERDGSKIYAELKNKHNTMNSSSAKSTYIKMQQMVLRSPNKDKCCLVEVIAPCSRNIKWECSIDGVHCENNHIRRVSIDQFYKMVTGVDDAFYQVCMQLPITLKKLVLKKFGATSPMDTVIHELAEKSPDMLKALYMLAFETYIGFSKL